MNETKNTSNAICPSSRCEEGANLLGVVKEDGHVDMLNHPFIINEAFVKKAQERGMPESRFRFAGKCVKGACVHWTGGSCGVIDKALNIIMEVPFSTSMPECAIRPQCRWFNQRGAEACQVCPFVITNVTG